jgi:hypothetical protein
MMKVESLNILFMLDELSKRHASMQLALELATPTQSRPARKLCLPYEHKQAPRCFAKGAPWAPCQSAEGQKAATTVSAHQYRDKFEKMFGGWRHR